MKPFDKISAVLLTGYCLLSVAAYLCFKEGGTDGRHRLLYFIVGNLMGITSTALLMNVYSRMQVNVAMVLATSGAFFATQLAFWLVYHTALTAIQCLGILIVGVGTAMTSCNGRTSKATSC